MSQGFAPQCKKISLDKLIVTPMGMPEPQCQSCMHKNCGHPIEPFNISIMGINKKWRLYNNNGTPMAVFDCEHYTRKQEE